MMDDNIANNIILSSGISLKEAFDNEAFDNEVRAYKSNDQVIERLCYHSGKEIRRTRRMLELRRKKGRL